MATLTYDPTPADQPEFTPEEQESIQIGEQMLEQQQQNLLAGKYANAQELEKAYIELQSKLGQSNDEETEEEEEEEEESQEVRRGRKNHKRKKRKKKSISSPMKTLKN